MAIKTHYTLLRFNFSVDSDACAVQYIHDNFVSQRFQNAAALRPLIVLGHPTLQAPANPFNSLPFHMPKHAQLSDGDTSSRAFPTNTISRWSSMVFSGYLPLTVKHVPSNEGSYDMFSFVDPAKAPNQGRDCGCFPSVGLSAPNRKDSRSYCRSS